ncbi:MAG: DUF3570 domain-containing protein [Mariniphaga sp.]
MRNTILIILTFFVFVDFAIGQQGDSTKVYKKKVLENAEVDLLMSLYNQDGVHSPVNGGIGTEKLVDGTPTITISIPLSDDDVLTVDAGISAYTSASSSNINPFRSTPVYLKSASLTNTVTTLTGASRGGGGTVVVPTPNQTIVGYVPIGTPWLASTGASHADKNKAVHADISHSSDSRNFIVGSNASYSKEYDYTSYGFGGNLTGLFNEKNTEIGLKGTVYLDTWKPIYPTELREYMDYGAATFQTKGYFNGVKILNQTGAVSTAYLPSAFKPWDSKGRNSYTLSFFASQILSQKLQVALFFDLVMQEGMLSTPYQRMYFADKPNYYIGSASDISIYTSPLNEHVYQLADDIERLPTSRYKLPIGVRMNYYINEMFVLRSYYRYYIDNWGLKANTVNLDLPVKLNQSFSVTPSVRWYDQSQADYFGPFETHLSTEKYYTSDYDLSKFTSMQYSMALNYTSINNLFHIGSLGLKNFNIKYSYYDRNDGLKANIFSFGVKFVNHY